MSPLLLTALILFAGWLAVTAVFWWLGQRGASLARRIEALEKKRNNSGDTGHV